MNTHGRPAGAAGEVGSVKGGRQPRAAEIAVQPDKVLDPIGGGYSRVFGAHCLQEAPADKRRH